MIRLLLRWILYRKIEKEGNSSKRIAHLTLNGEIAEGTGGGLFGGSGYDHESFLKQLDNVKKMILLKGCY